MDKQIIAIGGGGFGRYRNRLEIESYLLEQANISRPNICFIPTATGDDKSYIVNFYSAFSRLNCNPTHLELFSRTPDIAQLIANQNIVFVGGGNTKSMLAVWNEWGLGSILKLAYDNGTLLSGVSAGAICWFEQGVTDSWAGCLKPLSCLGFVSGSCCPHFDEEKERRPALHALIKDKSFKTSFAIDGGSALHFVNGQVRQSVAFMQKKASYIVGIENNSVVEKKITGITIC